MDRIKRILISLAVIFISFLFINEGKTILLIGDNIQIHLSHNLNSDLEIPHQHNFNTSHDDGTWMNSDTFELSYLSEKPFLYSNYLNKKAEDYTGLIWQPPKSV
jgi:hypothetical protein